MASAIHPDHIPFDERYVAACKSIKVRANPVFSGGIKGRAVAADVSRLSEEQWHGVRLALEDDDYLENIMLYVDLNLPGASGSRPSSDGNGPQPSSAAATIKSSQNRATSIVNNVNLAVALLKSLSKLVTRSTSLQRLNLVGFSLPAAGLKPFGIALASSSSLQYFSCRNCPMTAKGFSALAQGLKLNRSIRGVSLSGCGLTSGSGPALCEIFRSQSALRDELRWQRDLRGEGYTGDGLTDVDLSNNNLDDSFATQVVRFLRNDIWFRYLDLSTNSLAMKGVRAVASMALQHRYLEYVNLSGNPGLAMLDCHDDSDDSGSNDQYDEYSGGDFNSFNPGSFEDCRRFSTFHWILARTKKQNRGPERRSSPPLRPARRSSSSIGNRLSTLKKSNAPKTAPQSVDRKVVSDAPASVGEVDESDARGSVLDRLKAIDEKIRALDPRQVAEDPSILVQLKRQLLTLSQQRERELEQGPKSNHTNRKIAWDAAESRRGAGRDDDIPRNLTNGNQNPMNERRSGNSVANTVVHAGGPAGTGVRRPASAPRAGRNAPSSKSGSFESKSATSVKRKTDSSSGTFHREKENVDFTNDGKAERRRPASGGRSAPRLKEQADEPQSDGDEDLMSQVSHEDHLQRLESEISRLRSEVVSEQSRLSTMEKQVRSTGMDSSVRSQDAGAPHRKTGGGLGGRASQPGVDDDPNAAPMEDQVLDRIEKSLGMFNNVVERFERIYQPSSGGSGGTDKGSSGQQQPSGNGRGGSSSGRRDPKDSDSFASSSSSSPSSLRFSSGTSSAFTDRESVDSHRIDRVGLYSPHTTGTGRRERGSRDTDSVSSFTTGTGGSEMDSDWTQSSTA